VYIYIHTYIYIHCVGDAAQMQLAATTGETRSSVTSLRRVYSWAINGKCPKHAHFITRCGKTETHVENLLLRGLKTCLYSTTIGVFLTYALEIRTPGGVESLIFYFRLQDICIQYITDYNLTHQTQYEAADMEDILFFITQHDIPLPAPALAGQYMYAHGQRDGGGTQPILGRTRPVRISTLGRVRDQFLLWAREHAEAPAPSIDWFFRYGDAKAPVVLGLAGWEILSPPPTIYFNHFNQGRMCELQLN
jgi:hypothetical protein